MTTEKNTTASISDVLKSFFTDFEKKKEITKESIEDEWKLLVGEPAARHSRPVLVRKAILTVQVDSSVWMQELSMKKRQLLKGLKKTLGKDRICEIHFKIGEF